MKKQVEDSGEGEERTTASFTTPNPNHHDGCKQNDNTAEADEKPSRKIKEADRIEVPALPTILTVGTWKTRLINQVLVASGNPNIERIVKWISESWLADKMRMLSTIQEVPIL